MRLLTAYMAVLLVAAPALARQQGPDPTYAPVIARPAYAADAPVVLLDEGHGSIQTIEGRYAGFAALVRADGYDLRAGRLPLDAPGALDDVDVLVISNAAQRVGGASPSAFTVSEIRTVEAWVRAGGSLLLAADHAPHGVAAQALGRAFGVRMGLGYAFRLDGPDSVTSQMTFTAAAGTLGDHPILRGRLPDERVSTIQSFTGQSIAGPDGSTILMAMLPTDREAGNLAALQDISRHLRAGEPAADVLDMLSTPALAAQGVAFRHGDGRVVVLGEAGMLTAQMISSPGREPRRFGLQTDGHDDQQFALNILHWLSGLI